MKRLGNTDATNQLIHNIENLCAGRYDGSLYSEERHGYIFVQLSSTGHKAVRLQFDKRTQLWYLRYDLENVFSKMNTEDIINFIQTH